MCKYYSYTMDLKKCVRCETSKESGCFHTDKNTKDGLQVWCMECKHTYNKTHHLEKKEYYKEYHKKWLKRTKISGIGKKKTVEEKFSQDLKSRFSICRNGALSRGLLFDIDVQEFADLTCMACIYCGNFSKISDQEKYTGIDRENSNLGYIDSNCVPCCKKCNIMKASLTKEEFLVHIADIFRYSIS